MSIKAAHVMTFPDDGDARLAQARLEAWGGFGAANGPMDGPMGGAAGTQVADPQSVDTPAGKLNYTVRTRACGAKDSSRNKCRRCFFSSQDLTMRVE